MTKRPERTDRVVSLNGDAMAALTAAQEHLTAKLGFQPTYAQTILHMSKLMLDDHRNDH